jgi:hypothetical protein
MKKHSSSEEVQEQGCKRLGKLSVQLAVTPEAMAFISSGVFPAVVMAMQAHLQCVAVQREGCGALAILACRVWSRVAVASWGVGVEAVIRAMEAHPSSAAVQENACLVLRNVAKDVVRTQAITSLVENAVAAFPEHAKVQEYGNAFLFGSEGHPSASEDEDPIMRTGA